MADVAGTAVGVVSLGLEACKGLVCYIGHVKGEKREISQISTRLDNLADILEKLKTVLDNIEPTNNGSTLLANAGVIACTSALENVRRKWQPDTNPMHGFREAVRYWKSKLSYPFRREDILFLREMVESIQQNLHTALLALLL